MNRKEQIAQELSVVMPRIARTIALRFAKAYQDIPPAQIFTIFLLHDKGRCRVTDMHKALHVSAPTVSGLVDRLEKQGYVTREHDTKDRRVVYVELTKTGVKMAKEIQAGVKRRWKVILDVLSESDSENYLRIVKKINNQLQL